MGCLVVGVDLIVLTVCFDRPLGGVGVGRGQGGAHILEPDAVFEQRGGIQLDTDGGLGRTADDDLSDTLNLGQFLRQHVGCGVVNLAAAECLGRQCQDQHRRVGRVHLAVGRIASQAGREIGPSSVDGRLDVARGAVDVPVQPELQDDPSGADRTGGGHLGNVGDLAQMPFERTGDTGGDGVRAGAGQDRVDGDGRKIDLRQRRDRQFEKGKDACQRDADGQQRGGDGTRDERGGDVHSAGLVSALLPRSRQASRSNMR